jgi:hypothetical protein
MKQPFPGQIATRAAFIVKNLQQTDDRATENIDLDLGISEEPI